MRKVLIADDDRAILELLTPILSEQGYSVHSADDCMQAIKTAYAENPDLILMDIMMPEIGGIRVFEKLKRYARTASIPVVFMTAYPSDDLIHKLHDLGAAGYLIKPFDIEQLLNTLNQIR